MEHNHSEDIDLLESVARRGLLDEVKFLLEEKNVDVDSSGITGATALHVASMEGHVEIVRYLISRGANVNITHRRHPELRSITPLVPAVSRGHVEIAIILIQSGAKTDVVIEGRDLLDQAISSNNPKMVGMVISHGFDTNRRNDLGMTPLATAIRLRADESVEFLLENGADYKQTSIYDSFPLYFDIIGLTKKPRQVTELLFKHIEEIDGKEGVVNYLNSNDNPEGFTALHKACENGDYDEVKLSLEWGADPNIRDKEGRKPCDLLNDSFRDKKILALFESRKRPFAQSGSPNERMRE